MLVFSFGIGHPEVAQGGEYSVSAKSHRGRRVLEGDQRLEVGGVAMRSLRYSGEAATFACRLLVEEVDRSCG
jgi:hypothetical protein